MEKDNSLILVLAAVAVGIYFFFFRGGSAHASEGGGGSGSSGGGGSANPLGGWTPPVVDAIASGQAGGVDTGKVKLEETGKADDCPPGYRPGAARGGCVRLRSGPGGVEPPPGGDYPPGTTWAGAPPEKPKPVLSAATIAVQDKFKAAASKAGATPDPWDIPGTPEWKKRQADDAARNLARDQKRPPAPPIPKTPGGAAIGTPASQMGKSATTLTLERLANTPRRIFGGGTSRTRPAQPQGHTFPAQGIHPGR